MKQKKLHRNTLDVISILLTGFFMATLLFKHAEYQYSNAIALSDIIGFIVTIGLALYLAHVVEKSREQKNAIGNVLATMIQSLISECDEIQKAIYANNLNYNQAIIFPKRLRMTCISIGNIMDRAEFECPIAKDIIKKLGNMPAIRKNLTTLTPKSKDALDFFDLNPQNHCLLGPNRISKIQKNITELRNDLFALWATINL